MGNVRFRCNWLLLSFTRTARVRLAFCPIASFVCPARTRRIVLSRGIAFEKSATGINRRHTLTSLLIDESSPVPIGWLIPNQLAD